MPGTCKPACRSHSCFQYTAHYAGHDANKMRKDCKGCKATGLASCHPESYEYNAPSSREVATFFWAVVAGILLHVVLAVYAAMIILRYASGMRAFVLFVLAFFSPFHLVVILWYWLHRSSCIGFLQGIDHSQVSNLL